MRRYIMRIFFIVFGVLSCLADTTEAVEVVLKSGRVVRGELIRETATSITLQLSSSRIEISKLSIKTIDGRSPFEQPRSGVAASSDSTGKMEVQIPAGHFLMGDTRDKNAPVHKVYLDAYWVDTREVTNAQYREFVTSTGHAAPPVLGARPNTMIPTNLLWVFRGMTPTPIVHGRANELPTEAEWERAARGAQSRLYPWGDRFDVTRANTRETRNRRPMPVGTFPEGATSEGLLDMSGNVWEWCGDWFDEGYYRVSPLSNPTGPEAGKKARHKGRRLECAAYSHGPAAG